MPSSFKACAFSQAVRQKVDDLTSQLAGVAEQLGNRQQQHSATSHASDDSSDESVVKQRLRKVELTVAGELCMRMSFSYALMKLVSHNIL